MTTRIDLWLRVFHRHIRLNHLLRESLVKAGRGCRRPHSPNDVTFRPAIPQQKRGFDLAAVERLQSLVESVNGGFPTRGLTDKMFRLRMDCRISNVRSPGNMPSSGRGCNSWSQNWRCRRLGTAREPDVHAMVGQSQLASHGSFRVSTSLSKTC